MDDNNKKTKLDQVIALLTLQLEIQTRSMLILEALAEDAGLEIYDPDNPEHFAIISLIRAMQDEEEGKGDDEDKER